MTGVTSKARAGEEEFSGHLEVVHGEARRWWWPAFAMMVAVILLAALALAALAGHPHGSVQWTYVELPAPTVLAAYEQANKRSREPEDEIDAREDHRKGASDVLR